MCTYCEAARARRRAAEDLLAQCQQRYGIGEALRQTFRPEPLPADFKALVRQLDNV